MPELNFEQKYILFALCFGLTRRELLRLIEWLNVDGNVGTYLIDEATKHLNRF